VIEYLSEAESVTATSKALSVHRSTLYRWKKQAIRLDCRHAKE
ncbi:hypothetical protein L917_03442, partial [Phytophthora nicotianae]